MKITLDDTIWNIKNRLDTSVFISQKLQFRYGNIYLTWINLFKEYDSIANNKDNAWIYTDGIYKEPNGLAFEWDFPERLELDSCIDDIDRSEITQKWMDIMPIALFVGGDYAYWAMNKSSEFVFACINDGPEYTDIGNTYTELFYNINQYVK